MLGSRAADSERQVGCASKANGQGMDASPVTEVEILETLSLLNARLSEPVWLFGGALSISWWVAGHDLTAT